MATTVERQLPIAISVASAIDIMAGNIGEDSSVLEERAVETIEEYVRDYGIQLGMPAARLLVTERIRARQFGQTAELLGPVISYHDFQGRPASTAIAYRKGGAAEINRRSMLVGFLNICRLSE